MKNMLQLHSTIARRLNKYNFFLLPSLKQIFPALEDIDRNRFMKSSTTIHLDWMSYQPL